MGTVSYLLDTHTFLWAVRGSSKLSSVALEIVEDINTSLYVSAITAYEIINKYHK